MRYRYLLHDDAEDDAGVDLGLLRDLDNRVVDGALDRAGIGGFDVHEVLLVQVEHVVEIHPVGFGQEVGRVPVEAVVVFGVLVPGIAVGEGEIVPAKTRIGGDSAPGAVTGY